MYCKQILLCTVLLISVLISDAQQHVPDSLWTNYNKQTNDEGRLREMWSVIEACLNFRPDSALLYGEQSLVLATKIKSAKYESLTYNQIGTAYQSLGDYPNALAFYFKRLQMDERENDVYKKVITLFNIGAVYELENDFELARTYFLKAEKIINGNQLDDLKSMCYINLCDVFEKKNSFAAAFLYGKKALQEAQKNADTSSVGMSYNNIANVYSKTNQVDSALAYYRSAIPYLQLSNTYHTLFETYNGIALQMKQKQQTDSAIYYARLSASLAKSMQFNNYYLQSCNQLSQYFADRKVYDSAYYYQSQATLTKDSIFNDERAKKVQLLTMKEEIRQENIKKAEEKAKEDRSHELQMLAIGLLIPIFFFLSVWLSKRKIKPRVVELTGILSLLMSFEYITLLVHPAIEYFTNDTPVFELIVLIAIAAILTPAHHKIEEWLLHKLTVHRKEHIHIVTKKFSQKKPE